MKNLNDNNTIKVSLGLKKTKGKTKYNLVIILFLMFFGFSFNQVQAQDTDGDGVVDATDLDDDNDGILDIDECDLMTFNFTGADQTFVVPVGAYAIDISMWGAGGGDGAAPISSGGAGGFAGGILDVTPGDVITVIVGQGGEVADLTPQYGGGGAGGEVAASESRRRGSSGGGRTAIRLNGVEILTSGGGGGGPGGISESQTSAGGGGGGLTGQDALNNSNAFQGQALAGKGGTQIAGGAGGTGSFANSGQAGSQFQGGNGATTITTNTGGGGGGGGGYFGGGGGGAQDRARTGVTQDRSGGGGSGYIDNTVITDGVLMGASYTNAPNTSSLLYQPGIAIGGDNGVDTGGHGLVVFHVLIDTDNDTEPDYLDLDSDNDGCSDADEAYANIDADGGDTGIFGTDTPTLSNGGVNSNGLVILAGINGVGDAYTNTITTTAGGQETFRGSVTVGVTEDLQPQEVCDGEDALFTATATTIILLTEPITTAVTDITYQWQVSTDNGLNFNDILGETGIVSNGTQVSLSLTAVDTSLSGNIYRVSFSNETNFCGAESEAILTVNPLPTVNVIVENATLDQSCQNGTARILPLTGTPPFTYLWSANAGSQTTDIVTDLPNDTYSVTITDSNNCSIVQTVFIDCNNNCDPAISGEPDNDGDGVSDICDLDDDNDGIADVDECDLLTDLPFQFLNPGGEEPDISALDGSSMDEASQFNITITDANFIAFWNSSATDNKIEVWRNGQTHLSGFNAFEGEQWFELNAYLNPGGIFQEIVSIPGSTLTWSFAHRGREGNDTMELLIGDPSGILTNEGVFTTGTAAWVQYTGTYVVPVGQTVTRLTFNAISTGSGSNSIGNFLDDIRLGQDLNSVPCDTDGDTIPDFFDLDSDGDGCSDADEAYNDINADGGDNGIFGVGTPTLANGGVNNNGLVIVAGLNATGDAYTNTVSTTVGGQNTFQEGVTITVTEEVQPQEICDGEDALFTAIATTAILTTLPPTTASTDVTYQWQVSTDNGLNFNDIVGETGTVPSGTQVSLSLTAVDTSLSGNIYRVTFINEANICYEVSEALLTVLSLPVVVLNAPTDTCSNLISLDFDASPVPTGTDTGVFTTTAPIASLTDNGNGTASIDPAIAGIGVFDMTYTYIDIDGTSCQNSQTVSFEIFSAPVATITSQVNVNCFGESTGSIDLTVTNGNGPFSYLWSNGDTTEDINDLPMGTYTVTVTDVNLCQDTTSTIITEPTSGLTVSVVATDVLCNGEATGSVVSTVMGGTPPYTYIWSNGATTEDLINTEANTYTVTVTDFNGCMIVSDSATISEPSQPIGIVISKINATTGQNCMDGSATATASGGTGPYTYVWSASAANQTGQTATNLVSGMHTVLVTDANGCTLEQGVIIDCIDTCDAEITIDLITDVLCANENTGDATVSASSAIDSTATFTFTWDTTPQQVDSGVTSSTISNLDAGIYLVSVTIDGSICQGVEQSVTITEPASVLNVTATSTNESTVAASDGTATAVASGGTPPYTYSWSPGGETTNIITGLSAGNYTVTVTDANGCIQFDTVTVSAAGCNNLIAFAVSTSATCNGDSNGTATATGVGGSGLYSYLWSPNGETTSTLTGLSAGNYTVTITDTNTLCTAEATTTVNDPTVMSSGIAKFNVLCFGDTTGSLDLTVTGGTAPYTFAWDNGATTEDLFGLVSGTYTVTITDINGCQLIDSAIINQPAEALVLTIDSQTNINCLGTGSATIGVTGGVLPYMFSIDGGAMQTSNEFTSLAQGLYNVVVTDANGCTENIDITIVTNCIALVKTGVYNDLDADLCSDVDETITYTFTLTNSGNVPLSNITLTDPLLLAPNPIVAITFVSGDTNIDGILDLTETWIYTADYAVTQDDIDTGSVTNQATTTGTAPDTSIVTDLSDNDLATEDEPTVVVLCQTPTIALVKTGIYNDLDADLCSDVDETITYTFTITNTGNVTLNNITLTDPLLLAPNPLVAITLVSNGNGDGTLDLTETWIYTANYAVTQNDINTGSVTNQATVTGTAPDASIATDLSDNNLATEDEPTVVILCQTPTISLVKTGVYNDLDADLCSDVDETITYTFTITNNGNIPLSNITLTDPLLQAPNPIVAIAYVSGDTNIDGILDLTETWIYTADYAVTQSDINTGSVTNQATVTGTTATGITATDLSDNDLATEDEPTVVILCQNPSIVLIKEGIFNDLNSDGCTDVGETITYNFTVTNNGNVTLTTVDIDDPLVNVIGGPIDLTAGVTDSTTFTATYLITQQDINNGFVSNQATVLGNIPSGGTASDISDDNSILEDDPTIVTLCQEPIIALIKEVMLDDVNNNGCVDLGETLNYDFTVTNLGNVDLTNVIITDPLVTVAGGPINLGSGLTDTETFTATYIVTQDDVDNGLVTNQATAFGTAPDTTVVTDLSDDTSNLEDDPTIITICQTPTISLVKTGVYNDLDADLCSDVDETITYTFTVTNTGDVSLTNIIVTDPLLQAPNPVVVIAYVSGDTNGDGILDLTETWIYTADYAITQIDINTGSVTNQATVTGIAPDASIATDLSDNDLATQDDPTVVTLCQDPVISLVKTGVYNDLNADLCSDVDETITYTFTITNNGNVPLSTITLTDPLLQAPNPVVAITFVSGDTNGDGLLDLTETWIYTADYAITQDDINTGSVTNQATVTGIAPDASIATDLSDNDLATQDDPTVVTLCQTPTISLVKTGVYNDLDADLCSDVDETITYTFTVTNTGDVSLTNIIVTDPLLQAPNPVVVIAYVSGDTNGDGILDLTETWIYTADYAITQIDINTGSVTNQATVTGIAPDASIATDLSDNDLATQDEPTVVVLCQTPTIALVKTGIYNDLDADLCSDVDETITYTFTITNTGNVSLNTITLTDPLLQVPNPVVTIAYVSGDTNIDGVLDLTETWTYTADYAVTQNDIDTGSVTNQATATATAPDASIVTDLSDNDLATEDEPTVVVLCQTPTIALVKTGIYNDLDADLCSDVDETITYTFTITNNGNVPLSNITLTDPLLQAPNPVVAITYVSGDDGDDILQINETWIYTADYAVTQNDINTGSVTNQATVTGTTAIGTMATDLSDNNLATEDEPTVVVLCQNPSIVLIKEGIFNDLNNDGCSDVGETITYNFTVMNTGNVTLTTVDIDDPLVNVIGGPIDLVAGATDSTTFTATYLITQQDINNGFVSNQATVLGNVPSGGTATDLSDDNSILEDDPTIVTLCQEPMIALIKEVMLDDANNNGCVDLGETLNYDFTVTNLGNVDLTNVTITDPLVTVAGGPINLVSGMTDTETFTATYIVTQDDVDNGLVSNQATAFGTAPDSTVVTDLSDDTSNLEDDPTVITICQNPSIAIIKTGVYNDENGDACSNPNETITYTFTVTNNGDVSLTNIIVDDPLLGGMIAGPVSGDDGDNILQINETWVYTANYAISQADIDTGNVTNQATASGTTITGNTITDLSDDDSELEDDVTITVLCQNANIALIKTGVYNDLDADGCSDANETITYTFTVINNGNVSVNNILVTDPLVTVAGGPITLIPGETDNTSFTATYSVTQDDINNGIVINQATVEGTTITDDTVTDLSDNDSELEDDQTETTLCQNASIAIIKTGTFNDLDNDGCSNVGETITYTFTVNNTGNVTLTNVNVEDLLVNVIGSPITLLPNEENNTAFTAEYIITQNDIDTGNVTNQATANGTAPSGTVVSDLSDDDNLIEDDPTVTVLCQNSTIALIKTGTPVDENGNGCTELGESIVYDFVITNLGNVELTNIVVTDPLVIVIGNPINLAAGTSDTETFSATYTITQDDVDNGFVENQATVIGTTPDGIDVTDLSDNNSNFEDDITITNLCQAPSISVEKSGVFNDDNGNLIPEVGETITYTFTVTNTGNITLYDVTIQDPLPGITVEGGPIPVLLSGETDTSTFTATYAITQEDIDNGEVINQAVGTGTDINGVEVSDDSDDPTNLDDFDNNNDGDPDDPTVTIIPNVSPEPVFEIFNGVTPDSGGGDGLNDYFIVEGIEVYPNNNVKIFNRWGVKIFETDGYGGTDGETNVFRGISDGRATIKRGEELPTGTYYYIITFPADNPGKSSYAGYLYINR